MLLPVVEEAELGRQDELGDGDGDVGMKMTPG